MLGFEWAWYFQHRAMHDVPFLWDGGSVPFFGWEIGHVFHHTANRNAETLLPPSNFIFDVSVSSDNVRGEESFL